MRLLVVPSDPMGAYARGMYLSRIAMDYYNPTRVANEVLLVNPFEKHGRQRMAGYEVEGGSLAHLARVVKEFQPDMIRAYGGFWPLDLALWLRKKSDLKHIPVVVSLHDTAEHMLHNSIAFADAVMGVSPAVIDLAVRRGVPQSSSVYIPNWIDTGVFSPKADTVYQAALDKRFNKKLGQKFLLAVGRLTPQKNTDNLIKMVAELPAEYNLILLGHVADDVYAKQVAALGLAARVHFVSKIENTELPQWYIWADAMATPSRWEGFGIVFAEAAACGAKIITSNIAPMNGFLKHGISAELVGDFENPSALAGAVRKVVEDEKYSAKLTRGAVMAAQVFERSAVQHAEAAWLKHALAAGVRPLDERLDVWYRAFNGLPRWKLELRARLSKLKHAYPHVPA